MNDFIFYFKMGLFHVLDFMAYDHILFLIVLAVIYQIKQWKKVLWLITLFTVGHSITLALSAYGIVKINADLVEFLIPLSIFITGFVNVLTTKNTSLNTSLNISLEKKTGNKNQNLFFALLFGLIHGLGFSNYFKMMIGKTSEKLMPLLEFATGVEMAQIIIVLGILSIGKLAYSFLKINRRDWILVVSSIVMGIAFQMMINRVFW